MADDAGKRCVVDGFPATSTMRWVFSHLVAEADNDILLIKPSALLISRPSELVLDVDVLMRSFTRTSHCGVMDLFVWSANLYMCLPSPQVLLIGNGVEEMNAHMPVNCPRME